MELSASDNLLAHGQAHLLEHAAHLSAAQAELFRTQVQSIDWALVARLWSQRGSASVDDGLGRRAEPPLRIIRQPKTDADRTAWQAALCVGEQALRAGRVAVIVVAGGQGTRLGTTAPKGVYPIGPVSGASLFQGFFEQLAARQRRYQATIPYAVMTSDATHAETLQFFEQHHWFGLNSADVWPFCQGNMPAVDAETGRALLAGPGELALSPDGHGGLLAALSRSGLLQKMASRGIDVLCYHQVDNPSSRVADPAFIGWHLQESADISTKVVAKRSAEEKMGVAVSVDGVTQIIEYSDLPAEIAAQTNEDGTLRIWTGSTAMHVFQRPFLERALLDEAALPFHVAHKLVPYWTRDQGVVTPVKPNACKFERFIFDVMPWSQRALIVEANRAVEFNPVKNQSGADSPETARTALTAMYRDWLQQAGARLAEAVPVEISPLVALEADDIAGRVTAGTLITAPLLLRPETVGAYPWFAATE